MPSNSTYTSSSSYENLTWRQESGFQQGGSYENMEMASSPTNYSSPNFKNYSWQEETGFQQGGYYEKMDKPVMIRWKSGKRVDPRLLTMLGSFREIYEERREFFKRIFPGQQDEFVDVFEKVGAVMSTNKNLARVQTMQRSLSVGSPRTPKKIDRFKVRTPVLIVVPPGGQDDSIGQDGTVI